MLGGLPRGAKVDSELGTIRLAMQVMLVVWIWLVVRVVRRTVASGSVGLPAALVLTMSFLYGGAFVYAVPGYTHLRSGAHFSLQLYDFTEAMVMKGTFASLLGLLGFAIGCGALRRMPATTRLPPSVPARPGFGNSYLVVLGTIAIVSFGLHYAGVRFPLVDAVLETGRNLAAVVICLGMMLAMRKRRSLVPWLAVAALIPVYYMALFGFVSYGFLFATLLGVFWMSQRDQSSWKGPSIHKPLITVAMVYLLLTVFVGWFSFRDEVREVVWEGSGSLTDVLARALSETEWFSPWNFASLDLINIRLNLPFFIGRMIAQHELYPELREYGSTLIILPLVLLPRFLWPGKPERGGSGFMEEHTGMRLADSTSYGTGTVFEFFINFGYPGVFLGFLLFGWILMRLDRAAARRLQRGELMAYARLHVVGIIAIDPLLRPFFIVNGAIFAWLIMSALKMVLIYKRSPASPGLPHRRPGE